MDNRRRSQQARAKYTIIKAHRSEIAGCYQTMTRLLSDLLRTWEA